MRTSVLGSLSETMPASFATTWTAVPAERASWAPLPGMSSTAWTVVPSGISRRGSELPTRMSLPDPENTVSPTSRPRGRTMYRFSPSA